MKISLRPHHFLCLQGYKGLNYSENQVKVWNKIFTQLSKNPETDVFVISCNDDLCKNCPAILQKNKAQCLDDNVKKLDKIIADKLGITAGKTYKYNDIAARIKTTITQQIHENLCSGCAWWKKGLCRDSFKF